MNPETHPAPENQETLDLFYQNVCQQWETYLGYPNNPWRIDAGLSRFLDFPLRNVGDPFRENNCIHSCHFEREILAFFAELYHLQTPYSGYTTSGGTEGNLFGLYLARERLPGALLYCSEASHYSVFKAARVLNLAVRKIACSQNGEIDYAILERELRRGLSPQVIINANIGTTMTGAIDDVSRIQTILQKCGYKHHYIHCDAALSGLLLPFLEGAPLFDFRLAIDSLAVSTHKFLGGPIPCGVVLYRKNESDLAPEIAYIDTTDTTLLGSRDGFSVLLIWQKISQLGHVGLETWARACMQQTAYALKKLLDRNWPAWANPFANTVLMQSPGPELVKKWHLACQDGWAHLVIMPCTSRSSIDRFLDELPETAK